MRKKTRNIIIIAIALFVLLFVGILVVILSNRTISNPVGTVGNTAGNLNNSGLFCEYNGTVYFANAFDRGALYAMDPSEGNIRKLSNVFVCNILAGGDYLYYFQLGASGKMDVGNLADARSFNRCDLDGKNSINMSKDIVVTAQLVDDYLYLLTANVDTPSFYKLKIDKSEKVELADYTINPACAENSTIYYNGTVTDHSLYRLDTATDASYEIWNGKVWNPIVYGDYVYYMDVANNYRLCRYSPTSDTVEVLTQDRIDCYNIGSGFIYYQKNGETPQLKCMRTDGSDVQVIAEGNYTNINMTSQYVYFQEFGKDFEWYHSFLGTDVYDYFYAAKEAASAAAAEE